MTRWIALLRAINVGGHTVKMEALCRIFESLGLENVETYIASGNVIFDAPLDERPSAELKIESSLRQALGYEVATFLRTDAEISAIAATRPFSQTELEAATALNVAFLSQELDEQSVVRLLTRKTEIDDFHVHQREVYWLCRKKQSESTFSNAVLEKITGQPSTLRGASTIRKLADKYPPATSA
jgi:uncharacterized protein (DUF1697 family)